jgi:hypothetical protein
MTPTDWPLASMLWVYGLVYSSSRFREKFETFGRNVTASESRRAQKSRLQKAAEAI